MFLCFLQNFKVQIKFFAKTITKVWFWNQNTIILVSFITIKGKKLTC